MLRFSALALMICAANIAHAQKIDTIPAKPTLIEEYKGNKSAPSALIAMNEVVLHGSCSQRVGPIKVGGLQFSKSGATLESFWFVDKNGTQWSIPTSLEKMASNVERSRASSFIKVGKIYWLHAQVCGSGGFTDLISIYDTSIPFGIE